MPAERWSEYRLRRSVHFYELDPAGIVHFSWFFRYMEEAEHALWRAAGLSIAPQESGVAFPRVAATFDYQQPLRFEEEFDVVVRVAAIREKTIQYECLVSRGDTQIASGTMTVACVMKQAGGAMKAVPLPTEIRERFEVAGSP
jgi:YbgC/YbaW family acyl-CoA thioester hydrolase